MPQALHFIWRSLRIDVSSLIHRALICLSSYLMTQRKVIRCMSHKEHTARRAAILFACKKSFSWAQLVLVICQVYVHAHAFGSCSRQNLYRGYVLGKGGGPRHIDLAFTHREKRWFKRWFNELPSISFGTTIRHIKAHTYDTHTKR